MRYLPTVATTGHRTRRRMRAALGVVAASTMLLTACSSAAPEPSAAPTSDAAVSDPAWQQVIDDAKQEGSVVLYLSITGVEDRIKAAWSKAYPDISLEVFRTGSSELLTRLDQEKDTGAAGADAVVMADLGWYNDAADRLLAPEGPHFAELWEGSDFSKNDGRSVLVDAAPLGVAYNTEVIASLGADPIEEYADLLQPELDGYIGFTPAENAAATLQWWYTLTPALGGEDGIAELAELSPVAFPSLVPLTQALAAGEYAVAAYSSLAASLELKASGAPIEIVVPSPAIGGGHYVSVVDWATHKNAALLFRDWLLSPDGQIALNGAGDLYTPLSLDKIPGAPAEMVSTPDDMVVTDGIITPEQQVWMDDVWKAHF